MNKNKKSEINLLKQLIEILQKKNSFPRDGSGHFFQLCTAHEHKKTSKIKFVYFVIHVL